MKKQAVYLFGYGLTKHILVLNSHTIKYDDKISIDKQYRIIRFTFNQDHKDLEYLEDKVKQVLDNHSLDLYSLNVEDFYKYESLFENQEIKDAFFHCLHEFYRMSIVPELIDHKDYKKLSRLMINSYHSYQYYYHLHSQKQDYLMILAEKYGALGANSSNNHLVCLIENDKVETFIENMSENYKNVYGQTLICEENHD